MDQLTPRSDEVTRRARAVWEDHHARLWRSVLAWSGDREVASDAVAEAFAQALRRGDAIEHLDRWVWRTAFKVAAGLLAERRRDDGVRARDPADTASPPGDVVGLLDALAGLRADDRRLVVLALVGGWPSDALAEILGISPGTVRVRLHRAKKRLRTELEDHDG